MNKFKRKLKCKFYSIKFFFGKIVCKFLGHKETTGFGSSFEKFSLIKICPRCGKIIDVISTPIL